LRRPHPVHNALYSPLVCLWLSRFWQPNNWRCYELVQMGIIPQSVYGGIKEQIIAKQRRHPA